MAKGISFSATSDNGLVRDNNEDAFGLFSSGGKLLAGEGDLAAGEDLIVVVSDGVGGQEEGEVAAASVVASMGAGLGQLSASGLSPSDPEVESRIRTMAIGLNAHIRDFARHRGQEKQRMAATLTAAWFSRGRLLLVHVGDSRLYRWRQGQLKQLSVDDTAAGRALANGTMTEEQARQHPKRHVLERAIGVKPQVFEVQVRDLEVRDGDVYLLCSDGLTDGLSNDQLARACEKLESIPFKEFNEKLIDVANRNSGKDNVTVALAGIGEGWCAASQARETGEKMERKTVTGRAAPWIPVAILLLAVGFLAWGLWSEKTRRESDTASLAASLNQLEDAVSDSGLRLQTEGEQREALFRNQMERVANGLNTKLEDLALRWSRELDAADLRQGKAFENRLLKLEKTFSARQESTENDLVYLRKWLGEVETELSDIATGVEALSKVVQEQEQTEASAAQNEMLWWGEPYSDGANGGP